MFTTTTAATAVLLLAAAGTSMAVVPSTGTYDIGSAYTTALGTLTNSCDNECLKSFGILKHDATKISMKGISTSATCKCVQIDTPWDVTTGATFTKTKFSEGGVEMTGSGKGVALEKPATTPAPVPSTNVTTTTRPSSPTTSSSTHTSTATAIAAVRRREIFARAVDSQINLVLTPAGGTSPVTLSYNQSADTKPVGISGANKIYVAGAAAFSAAIAAIVAGVVAM